MERARELYREGRLTEAVEWLQTWLRDKPTDAQARSFLFELLCFAGEFERARKQLAVLTEGTRETRLGMAFYFAAINAEVERHEWYHSPPLGPPLSQEEIEPVRGRCNGEPFCGIHDLDTRLGDALEFLSAGRYHRISVRNVCRVEFTRPARVRDLYWRLASIQLSPAMASMELDSVLIPVLYPQTYLFDDDLTRLGRKTDFALSDSGDEIPCGQRIMVIGGKEIPILDVEVIEIENPVATAA